MCGAYLGVDEYKSKLAVLREKFEPDNVLEETSHIKGAVENGRNIWREGL
jgi:trimethyllysine dioxygenase